MLTTVLSREIWSDTCSALKVYSLPPLPKVALTRAAPPQLVTL